MKLQDTVVEIDSPMDFRESYGNGLLNHTWIFLDSDDVLPLYRYHHSMMIIKSMRITEKLQNRTMKIELFSMELLRISCIYFVEWNST